MWIMSNLKYFSHLKYSRVVFFLMLTLGGLVQGFGQTIQFSLHVSSTLDATNESDMQFETILSGSGLSEINLGDSGMGVFGITGDDDLDVIVTMTAPANLTHDGASPDVIPFTLKFAYANKGVNDVNQAVEVNSSSVRFQIRNRESGPAGAPPTPPSGFHTPSQSTAYIYIYGSMTVGSIDAGSYSGSVDLSVIYD